MRSILHKGNPPGNVQNLVKATAGKSSKQQIAGPCDHNFECCRVTFPVSYPAWLTPFAQLAQLTKVEWCHKFLCEKSYITSQKKKKKHLGGVKTGLTRRHRPVCPSQDLAQSVPHVHMGLSVWGFTVSCSRVQSGIHPAWSICCFSYQISWTLTERSHLRLAWLTYVDRKGGRTGQRNTSPYATPQNRSQVSIRLQKAHDWGGHSNQEAGVKFVDS